MKPEGVTTSKRSNIFCGLTFSDAGSPRTQSGQLKRRSVHFCAASGIEGRNHSTPYEQSAGTRSPTPLRHRSVTLISSYVPVTKPWHRADHMHHPAYCARALLLGGRAAVIATQDAGLFPGTHVGGDAAKWDAGMQVFLMPFSLVNAALNVKDVIKTGVELRGQLRTMNEHEKKHQAFVEALKEQDEAKVRDDDGLATGRDVTRLDAQAAMAYLQYEDASRQAEQSQRTMQQRIWQGFRDGPSRLVGVAAHGVSAPILNLPNTFKDVVPSLGSFGGAAGAVTSTVHGITYTLHGWQELRTAKAKVKAVDDALERVDGIGTSKGNKAPIADLLKIAYKAAPFEKGAPLEHRERKLAAAKQGKLKTAIREVSLTQSGAAEIQMVQGVYGAINATFERNQVQAKELGRIEKWFGRIRMSYGIVSVALGVTTIALLIAGSVASMGMLTVVVVGVSGLYYAYSFGRHMWVARNNARQAAQESREFDKAFKTLEDRSPDQFEKLLLEDQELCSNRYLSGYLLAAHLCDRSDIKMRTGHSRDYASPVYLRRKLATRYLLASGMSRTTIRALKALADTPEGMTKVVGVVGDHLYGSRARATKIQSDAWWTRLLRPRRR